MGFFDSVKKAINRDDYVTDVTNKIERIVNG
jgi:hypothetical protein